MELLQFGMNIHGITMLVFYSWIKYEFYYALLIGCIHSIILIILLSLVAYKCRLLLWRWSIKYTCCSCWCLRFPSNFFQRMLSILKFGFPYRWWIVSNNWISYHLTLLILYNCAIFLPIDTLVIIFLLLLQRLTTTIKELRRGFFQDQKVYKILNISILNQF